MYASRRTPAMDLSRTLTMALSCAPATMGASDRREVEPPGLETGFRLKPSEAGPGAG